MARPTPAPVQWGVVPAAVYVALAAVYVMQLGIPE
jgi:hypothetical protein